MFSQEQEGKRMHITYACFLLANDCIAQVVVHNRGFVVSEQLREVLIVCSYGGTTFVVRRSPIRRKSISRQSKPTRPSPAAQRSYEKRISVLDPNENQGTRYTRFSQVLMEYCDQAQVENHVHVTGLFVHNSAIVVLVEKTAAWRGVKS